MSDAETLTALGLRVVFRSLADRYAHVVVAVHGGDLVAIAESLEGTGETDWPPSPALQQLHFETRADGSRLALLVGRAGGSHWSLSVEAKPDSPRVTFDVACRLRESPLLLGSEYRLFNEATMLPADQTSTSAACIRFAAGARILVEPIEGAATTMLFLNSAPSTHPVGVARSEPRKPLSGSLQGLAGAVRIEPPAAAAPWPKTVRWKYSITGQA